MRVFVIGVAGAGMAPLAGLLRQAGYEVRGSDVSFDPPMGPLLSEWGVETRQGTDPALLDGLDPKTDLVVVGNVCRRDHPLAVAAEQRGLRRVSLPTALRELVFTTPASPVGGVRPVVAIAGTHGKTTTTALLATILSDAGLDPGWLVGGVPTEPLGPRPFALGRAGRSLIGRAGRSLIGRAGRSLVANAPLAPFVIEGDEYDSAFFKKQPKVWGYAPKMALLTSIEHDHVDIYPNEASYLAAFRGLLERMPSEDEGGLLVANAADPRVRALVAEARPRCRVVFYAGTDASGRPFPGGDTGDEPPIWTGHEVGLVGDGDALQKFDLFVGPTIVGRYGVGVFGAHNVANTIGAVALAVEGFGLPVREVCMRLARFRGVKRRLERLVDPDVARGVTAYDDFAHHPTAIEATLRAARARHRDARLIALYEPRSATACRAMHQDAYVSAFAPADVVVLAPLGRSTIPEAERLDLERLARDLRGRGKTVETPPSIDDLLAAVDGMARSGDVVVSMSNGAFGGVPRRLPELLASRERAEAR
ncbi:MAG: UDP-N-acetylmuramate:L-alanyl-gamma-D-glutamyl-meso-diaminopimelate ligase [Deltaproteobacteria bacterium]|nr:UDP-N-acetylmuramate:L-alanyl-gamma-D-glutamyl-meso-diaminopimelate ligase [Deltaproteobacteria bacterium]